MFTSCLLCVCEGPYCFFTLLAWDIIVQFFSGKRDALRPSNIVFRNVANFSQPDNFLSIS